MIEFTLWDIVRNLLFATRWTMLLAWSPRRRRPGGRADPARADFQATLAPPFRRRAIWRFSRVRRC